MLRHLTLPRQNLYSIAYLALSFWQIISSELGRSLQKIYSRVHHNCLSFAHLYLFFRNPLPSIATRSKTRILLAERLGFFYPLHCVFFAPSGLFASHIIPAWSPLLSPWQPRDLFSFCLSHPKQLFPFTEGDTSWTPYLAKSSRPISSGEMEMLERINKAFSVPPSHSRRRLIAIVELTKWTKLDWKGEKVFFSAEDMKLFVKKDNLSPFPTECQIIFSVP